MTGRPRKPTALKELTGTKRKDRTNTLEPVPPPLAPGAPPADLDRSLHVYWNEYRGLLDGCNVLTEADQTALRMLCQTRFYFEFYKSELEKNGAVVMTPNGFPVQSPYAQLYNKSFEQLHKMLTEFGMTPQSRSKVSAIQKPVEADPFAEFS